MKTLELVKRWTGDGFGDTGARTLTQLKRNDKVALYSRTVEVSKFVEGYEVFIIKVRHKGDALPGGMVEEEDREVYPSAGSFGKTAWQINRLERAEKKFDEVTNGEIEDDSVKEPAAAIIIPVGEFSVKDLAEKNHAEYAQASMFIKDAVASGTVKFLREERRSIKGKPSKIYAKA